MKLKRSYLLLGAALLNLFGVCWLWIMSYHAAAEFGFSTARAHYTIRSENGRLYLMGPPAPQRADLSKESWDALRQLREEDIDWTRPQPRPGTAAARIAALGYPVRPLLRALDGRRKFAAAHVLLCRSDPTRTGIFDLWKWQDGAGYWNGLEVRPKDQSAPAKDERSNLVSDFSHHMESLESGVIIDPSQLSQIRKRWHQLLDVQMFETSYFWLVLITSAAPAVLLRGHLRRFLRKRRGHCVTCGYDIRSSPTSCPECGELIEASHLPRNGRQGSGRRDCSSC
jgi:hypothetical protein